MECKLREREHFFLFGRTNNILINEMLYHIKVFSQAGDLLHTIRREELINFGIIAHNNNLIHVFEKRIEIFSAEFCELHSTPTN